MPACRKIDLPDKRPDAKDKDLHHIYTDETYFRYEVTLTRDEEAGGVKGQRYVLYVSYGFVLQPGIATVQPLSNDTGI